MKKVKRPAKVGEQIIITNVDDLEKRYLNGDIFEVIEICNETNDYDVFVKGYGNDDEWLVYYDEYMVLEGYLEKDDAVDALQYCINDVLSCKTVELKVDKPIAFINEDGLTFNNNDIRTIFTPDGIFSYKDDKLIFELKNKTENEKEGMINMNRVLLLYADKHHDEIAKKYDDLVEKEYNELEVVRNFEELVNTFETNLELMFNSEENILNNVFERVVTENVYKYDINKAELKSKIAFKYVNQREEENRELDELIKEVNAQLSLSDDLEYQLDVLKRYDIINKKTNKIN